MMKTRLGIFDQYDSALMDIDGLNVRAILDIEFKDENGCFEEYNHDWQYLKAILYEDDMSYDFTQPDSFSSQIKFPAYQNTIFHMGWERVGQEMTKCKQYKSGRHNLENKDSKRLDGV